MAHFDDRRRVQNENLENGLMNEVGLEYQNYNRNEMDKDMTMYRSGSAPPTIEGSYNTINRLFRKLDFPNGGLPEEEMRSHPAYLSYYYSHDNINPRLPPLLLSKEEWRMQQRMRSGGLPCREFFDWRKRGLVDDGYESSLFSVQPALSVQKEKSMPMPRQDSSLWLDNKDHVFVRDGGATLGVRRKSFVDIVQEGSNRPTALPVELWNGLEAKEGLHSTPGLGRVHTHHSSPSSSFSTVVGSSFSRSSTPEFQRVSRSPTLNLLFEERFSPSKLKNIDGSYVTNGKSSSMNNLSDFAACLSLTSLDHPGNEILDNGRLVKSQIQLEHANQLNFQPNMHIGQQQQLLGKSTTQKSGGQFNGRCGNNMLLDHHYQPTDLVDVQYYMQHVNPNLLLGGKYISASHSELSESQKAHLDALISGQKQRFGLSLHQKGPGINEGYYEGLAYLLGMPYQGASMDNSLSDIRFGNSMLQSDISTSMKGTAGMTLLEEFKNKTRPFELFDIVGHVVEFSMDQCGSRFIQQKLEIATNEEKMKLFLEIAHHARALMTDVFGNYVIQKLFERGMDRQRNVLVGQIKSHVLQLSLQMYGCRVIQKALETIDVDLKTQMVTELDGSVLKCVCDQNGNHVIQKCIECVPEDKIQFIISSFFGQVVPLSTHPYGCRVIQRVLERSNREDTQKRIMVEIMDSICTLAQNQYGNYVIHVPQLHVIQHSKVEERFVIINKLAGQVVQMSQQKFASNVIEKCLTFGSPEERQVLVSEMLGSTDVNEPLQDMMKDPFGNYVVQKVLETCDEKTRELILSHIKLHLCDMKKYTYVKHVVARVEKLLITARE